MKKGVWGLVVVAALQTALLAGMIAKRQYTLSTGTPVLLETLPVDPRSLFRGDYVTLRYKVQTILVDKEKADTFHRGDTVYTVLAQDGKYWTARDVSAAYPDLAPGQIAMRGEVQYTGASRVNDPRNDTPSDFIVRVEYGIHSYFVPEGEGRRLERPSAAETIDIQVAVDAGGNAAIKALLLNGEPVYAETLF